MMVMTEEGIEIPYDEMAFDDSEPLYGESIEMFDDDTAEQPQTQTQTQAHPQADDSEEMATKGSKTRSPMMNLLGHVRVITVVSIFGRRRRPRFLSRRKKGHDTEEDVSPIYVLDQDDEAVAIGKDVTKQATGQVLMETSSEYGDRGTDNVETPQSDKSASKLNKAVVAWKRNVMPLSSSLNNLLTDLSSRPAHSKLNRPYQRLVNVYDPNLRLRLSETGDGGGSGSTDPDTSSDTSNGGNYGRYFDAKTSMKRFLFDIHKKDSLMAGKSLEAGKKPNENEGSIRDSISVMSSVLDITHVYDSDDDISCAFSEDIYVLGSESVAESVAERSLLGPLQNDEDEDFDMIAELRRARAGSVDGSLYLSHKVETFEKTRPKGGMEAEVVPPVAVGTSSFEVDDMDDLKSLFKHASLRGDATDMDGDGYDFAVNEDEVVGNDDLLFLGVRKAPIAGFDVVAL